MCVRVRSSGYRICFSRDGQEINLVLTGGEKQRQQRDIDAAIAGSFDDLVRHRMSVEPGVAEALSAIRSGDAETGRAMLRNYFGEHVPTPALTAAK